MRRLRMLKRLALPGGSQLPEMLQNQHLEPLRRVGRLACPSTAARTNRGTTLGGKAIAVCNEFAMPLVLGQTRVFFKSSPLCLTVVDFGTSDAKSS